LKILGFLHHLRSNHWLYKVSFLLSHKLDNFFGNSYVYYIEYNHIDVIKLNVPRAIFIDDNYFVSPLKLHLALRTKTYIMVFK